MNERNEEWIYESSRQNHIIALQLIFMFAMYFYFLVLVCFINLCRFTKFNN
jgi:uncharacterized membrane protein (DUF485 family)